MTPLTKLTLFNSYIVSYKALLSLLFPHFVSVFLFFILLGTRPNNKPSVKISIRASVHVSHWVGFVSWQNFLTSSHKTKIY